MTTPKPPLTREELIEQLRKVVVGSMERGNMYEGYVASAEFNAEAVKVSDTYVPMLLALFDQAHKRELLEARLDERDNCLRETQPMYRGSIRGSAKGEVEKYDKGWNDGTLHMLKLVDAKHEERIVQLKQLEEE